MMLYDIIHCILSKGTEMAGSFLFVKPSDPEGKHGTAYSDESPRYPYDQASWEWLLERALRRALLPWALTKSHSRDLLYGHEGQYSMHRWGSYGESHDAGSTPFWYQSVGGPGSDGRETDADLSADDREKKLPESWDSTGAPTYSDGTKVAYGIADLEEAVARLPFSLELEWLHPGWSPSDLDAWDLTASTTETTTGSAPSSPDRFNWTWETTVAHFPYKIPDDVPFKCLSHMRTDDETVPVSITNDDGEKIEVEIAPTPVAAPRIEGGSIRDYHDTKVRIASYGAALAAGWALSEFSIKHIYGLDYSQSTGSSSYDRGRKTSESYTTDNPTLGCLIDIPDEESGNIVVSQDKDDKWARFVRAIDWGGKQTWWHANGFPKGLDSVLSQKLKDQLKALCPKCQPAIPPAVPAFWEKFPDADLPWDYSSAAHLSSPYEMYPQKWMRHLALACPPIDISARLDAMTTTVHRVPTIFAKIRKVTTEYKTSRTDGYEKDIDGNEYTSWEESTYSKVKTVEGTSSDPIPAGDELMSVSGECSGAKDFSTTITNSSGTSSESSKTQTTWKEGVEANSEFLVCLRSTANTTLSTKTTTTTTTTDEYSYKDPSGPETETLVDGKLPDSYDPDPDDLLFPDWVIPWINTAELFVSIESRLGRTNGADYTETERHYYPYNGSFTSSYSGSGSGTRTHKARRKIVSLGKMDPSTGRFPAVDAAEILSEVDPDPNVPTGWSGWGSYTDTTTETTDSDGNKTKKTVRDLKDHVSNYRSRSVSYYVVVKWKFDRTDPETLET